MKKFVVFFLSYLSFNAYNCYAMDGMEKEMDKPISNHKGKKHDLPESKAQSKKAKRLPVSQEGINTDFLDSLPPLPFDELLMSSNHISGTQPSLYNSKGSPPSSIEDFEVLQEGKVYSPKSPPEETIDEKVFTPEALKIFRHSVGYETVKAIKEGKTFDEVSKARGGRYTTLRKDVKEYTLSSILKKNPEYKKIYSSEVLNTIFLTVFDIQHWKKINKGEGLAEKKKSIIDRASDCKFVRLIKKKAHPDKIGALKAKYATCSEYTRAYRFNKVVEKDPELKEKYTEKKLKEVLLTDEDIAYWQSIKSQVTFPK